MNSTLPKDLYQSFRALTVQKIIEEKGRGSTISNIPKFVAKVVHESYANLSDNIEVLGEPQFEMVYVRGHIYNFPPRAICDCLHIPILHDFDFKKDYALNDAAKNY